MTSRLLRGAAAAVLLVSPACTGCASSDADPVPEAAASVATPTSAAELEALLVEEVPSGLPRVPDDELAPPAGEKTIDDVARYGQDAQRQQEVLADYGYTRGWERFWRSDEELTSVFIDQFADPAGAVTYADDLARNDAEHYGGDLDRSPGGLPDDCVLLAQDDPAPETRMSGPAVFAWCSVGVFTVAVAAVADTPEAARRELEAVTTAQLARLPAG
ncbi:MULTISPECIES: hypothetical protein [unclassified Modestobacter]|uniref:hypothetical protein n=1 Tax=unclassified Modestobacter TaxID=2643866 RepID=UPI0022AB48E1|nr:MULTISPECIES: hypothetical protein [unclassified Modestobacter]MCZ2824058.1 hypothetical protein [Modestobacter sp. VKM Ac-2981]MCZ2852303.1 hypothetical protein [Modestobacter sp. VKM Ac-2982]